LKHTLLIISVCIFIASNSDANTCPDKEVLMKNLRVSVNDSILPYKVQIARWLPYLDSLKNCGSDDDSVVAFLNKKIGALYNYDKDFLNAIKYYSSFLDISRANLGKPNIHLADISNGYYWLADMYNSLQLNKEKMAAIDSCIFYSDKNGIYNQAGLNALYQKVEYFFDLGDYFLCIDYATKCESIARECQQSRDPVLRIAGFEYNSSSSAWKINAILQLGDYGRAEEYIKRKIREAEQDKSGFNLGTLYAQLAEVQRRQGNYGKSVELLTMALQYEQREKLDFGCKQVLNILGRDIYFDYYHDDIKALQCYKKALSIHNRDKYLVMSDIIESLNIYTNIAELFLARNQFDTAFHYYKLAFSQIMPGLTEDGLLFASREELLRHKKVNYVTNLLISKGRAYQKKYVFTGEKKYLLEALKIYRLTDQFLDLLRKEQTILESKLFWRKDTRRLYEHAIDASYILHDEAGAFYFFEKSRAVLLNDQLTHQRWAGDKEIRKEIQLSKNIIQLQRRIDTTDQTDAAYGELVRENILLKTSLENIRRRIKADNPLYIHNQVDTGFLTISTARNFILPGYEALMEIFTGDSAVYVMAMTPDNMFLKKLKKSAYVKLSQDVAGLLSDQGILNSKFNNFLSSAHELYSLIFQGINIPAGRIIISPDGPVIPFEALVVSKPGETVRYLLQDYAISYAYSAQFLEGVAASINISRKDFMGLAPIHFNQSFQLVSLTGSDKSLAKINGLFRESMMLIGTEVTPHKFMDEFYQYQIVQLYTHASDYGKYNEPVIYFGDSSVNLSDLVYEAKPFTRLMVLSACETASGKNYVGEGVFSFSRGFAALGIPSSISNLWSVENESTYRLTELFYKYLAEGLPLDVSLQKAKLEFLKTASREKQLPYFWAALILSGRSDPIPIKNPLPLPFLLTGIIAGLSAIGLVWKWYRKKKSTQAPGKAGTLP
jgi:CHAT domain-containing protein